MTIDHCTASSAVSKNLTYPTLVTERKTYHVAEDKDDYHTPPPTHDQQSWTIKQIQLRALQTTGFGQIGRLYQLSTLLRESSLEDWDAEQRLHYSREIQDATGQLETLLCDIVDPLTEKPDSEDELDD